MNVTVIKSVINKITLSFREVSGRIQQGSPLETNMEAYYFLPPDPRPI